MGYTIGEKIWTAGNEITITTKPYVLYGGEFQDGIDDNGKTITVATPAEREATVKRNMEAHKTQQAEFARLKN